MGRNPATLVAEQQRMTTEDKATGSDSLSKKNPDRGSEGSGVAQHSVNV